MENNNNNQDPVLVNWIKHPQTTAEGEGTVVRRTAEETTDLARSVRELTNVVNNVVAAITVCICNTTLLLPFVNDVVAAITTCI
jgi:hypothetical protein